ncbi:hypothetical protein GCM10009850_034650 [Nonomuraea monospora]|uniref:Uncharacterized protein n=1 Tax=Nonomuraea monospora TaxID=568818 RepID=A0ABN3CGT9_9ACTN
MDSITKCGGKKPGSGTRDRLGSNDRYGGSENARNATATTISGATHGRRHQRGRAGGRSVGRVMRAACGPRLTTGLPRADDRPATR